MCREFSCRAEGNCSKRGSRAGFLDLTKKDLTRLYMKIAERMQKSYPFCGGDCIVSFLFDCADQDICVVAEAADSRTTFSVLMLILCIRVTFNEIEVEQLV